MGVGEPYNRLYSGFTDESGLLIDLKSLDTGLKTIVLFAVCELKLNVF